MKHLKTYEALPAIPRNNNMPQFQKYLAYQIGLTRESRSFAILEVIHQFHSEDHLFPDRYIVKRLYIANENSIRKSESEENMSFNYEETKNRIKYQSDDLQDVIDMIPALYEMDKYNL